MKPKYAVGIDGCSDGWVVVTGETSELKILSIDVISSLEHISEEYLTSHIVIDIPIHLYHSKIRLCDKEAKAFLGKKFQSSIFYAPPAEILTCVNYIEANKKCKEMYQVGLSKQSWNLFPKILEAQSLNKTLHNYHEGHPECSFKLLNHGNDLKFKKKNPLGIIERYELLQFNRVHPQIKNIKHYSGFKLDDLLDACSIYWTAYRRANHLQTVLGDSHKGIYA